MRTSEHPYRLFFAPPDRPKRDSLEAALRFSKLVVGAWALLRLTPCSFRRFDFECLLAICIVIALSAGPAARAAISWSENHGP